MNMNTNIHGVVEVKIERRAFNGTRPYFATFLIVTDKLGNRYEICLFSEAELPNLEQS